MVRRSTAPRRVEQEVRRERRDPGNRGPGQRAGVDEDDGAAPVQLGEQFRLRGVSEVGVPAVGQQDQPIGPQLVEGPGHLADGGVDRGQRDRGEEPERQPARVGDAPCGLDDDDTHLPAG